MDIILASQSPRRQQLLEEIVPFFTVQQPNVDEAAITAPTPIALAAKLATTKAEAVALSVIAASTPVAVLGFDTIVQLGTEVFGKPPDEQGARTMLTKLAGNKHFVHTGVCLTLVTKDGLSSTTHTETTEVWVTSIETEALEAYIATPEPYDKAGGYGIQGWAAKYIPKINGCYYNIMGLPVAAVYRMLTAAQALPCKQDKADRNKA